MWAKLFNVFHGYNRNINSSSSNAHFNNAVQVPCSMVNLDEQQKKIYQPPKSYMILKQEQIKPHFLFY